MQTRLLLGLLGVTATGCGQPVTKVIVMDGDTVVTVESSDCCCDDNACCDDGDADGGGDDSDPVDDDDGDDGTTVVDTDDDDDDDDIEPEDCGELDAPSALEPELTEECTGPATPVDSTWEPEVEWTWAPTTDERTFNQVMMTPVVGNLTDDNGDGVIDASDTPDVAFIAYYGTDYGPGEAGSLVILDGATGAEHYYTDLIVSESESGAAKDYAASTGGVALGDVDADGIPEACFPTAFGRLVCMHADGKTVFQAYKDTTIPYDAHVAGYPAIGDVDGNGVPEVFVGSFGWGMSGFSAIQGLGGVGAQYDNGSDAVSGNSVLADILGGTELEIIAGNTVYDYQGTILWQDTSAKDGVSAVADLDLDGTAEVVTVAFGIAHVWSASGTLVQSFSLDYCTSTVATCGTPAIADFNGDGIPDIGVAGDTHYAVYTDSGTGFQELWSNPISDASGAAGASVFDFEDDGINEVVFSDEGQLYIWRGSDGTDLLSGTSFDATQHASGTLYEMPVVADVDNDGESEIVLASNTLSDSTGWSGVRVIGSGSGDAWAPSRPVWNQHSYHITNVEDDLSIPATESQHWLGHNNFRVADESAVPDEMSTMYADLQVQEGYQICFDCEADEATLYIRVANAGEGDADATEVAFVTSEGEELARVEVEALAAGASTVLGPLTIPTGAWFGTLDAIIDPDDAITECDEDNNLGSHIGQVWSNECF